MPSLPSLPSLPSAIYAAALVSFAVAVLLVFTKRWHGRFSMDGLMGIQKMHTTPTPRIGGVSIFAGVVAGWMVSAPGVAKILGILILAGLPAFVFGLLPLHVEDVFARPDAERVAQNIHRSERGERHRLALLCENQGEVPADCRE